MFDKLNDFGFVRNAKQAVGFYIIYTSLPLSFVMALGFIYGIFTEATGLVGASRDVYIISLILGRIFVTVYSAALIFAIARAKGFKVLKTIILILLGAVLAGLLGIFVAGLVAACMTCVATNAAKSVAVDGEDNQAGQVATTPKLKIDYEPLFDFGGFVCDLGYLLSLNTPWAKRSVLEKACAVMSVAMLIGMLPLPYGYYTSLRVVTCICLGFFLERLYPLRTEKPLWFCGVIGLLVLYNPIIPVRIGMQEIWICLNFLTLFFLFNARLVLQRLDPPQAEIKACAVVVKDE